MKWASLRVRVGLWYALFTLSCLSLFGLLLFAYLEHALEASRAPTMIQRVARAEAFVRAERRANPARPLSGILQSFLAASPESDGILVRTQDGRSTLFVGGSDAVRFPQAFGCAAPCFREFAVGGRHLRSYTRVADFGGGPLLLTLAGSVDEHYGILRTVQTSYLLFIPFLLLASIGGGYLLSGRSLAPVGRITATASQLSIFDLSGRVPVPMTGDELQTLAEAWNEMLERLQRSVEKNAQFTSDASHDLRTSIAVMLASAQLALRKPRTGEQYCTTLRTLVAECDHTLRLLEDLLAAARDGFEQHELELEPLDLSALLEDRCRLFAAEAEAKQQTLTVALQPDAWLSGDRSLLHRLIGILIDNAIKYTPAGGAIAVRLRREEATLLLEVEDSGPGIASAHLSRIFGRAFRILASEAGEPGSGLGLNIARWIADAHGATLSVQSTPGQGSLFEVSLPVLPGPLVRQAH